MAHVENWEVASLDESGNFECNGTVTASGGISGGTYTVATLPTAVAGMSIFVSDGAEGDPVLSFSDGTDWLRCDTLAAVSAT